MLALSFGCGKNTEEYEGDRVIKSETSVLDIRISQNEPDESFNDDSLLRVGFQGANEGNENRMLIYFPAVENLNSDDVVLGSITSIEILINCTDVPVNPKNIRMYPMITGWSPVATWNSKLEFISGSDWDAPGGDYNRDVTAITPALRENNNNSSLIELAFDVTELVTGMVANGTENFGFVIMVEASDLNGADELGFLTYNSSASSAQPTASLVFSEKDVIE